MIKYTFNAYNYGLRSNVILVAAVVVVVIVAMVMMTRRRGMQGRHKHRPTSIELHTKPTLNGVKHNGGAAAGSIAFHRPRRAENGPTGDGPVPRVPLVGFSDQVGGDSEEIETVGVTGVNCSVEALSLIPGRDINHEGPHRVYQWTDF